MPTVYDRYVLLANQVEDAAQRGASTKDAVKFLQSVLGGFCKQEFASLLAISGYIPDYYPPDSWQETLYSKFVELLVCEWAKRIGFDDSYLPTQKSSTEDITIADSDHVIVGDAKSFRLGRSQAAPNVKDVVKQGDFPKWLRRHTGKKKLGGIVAFPSLFEWKTGSDVHIYLTDSDTKILMLYYEHMAFILKCGMKKESLIQYFEIHNTLFLAHHTTKSECKRQYHQVLNQFFFSKHKDEYDKFIAQTKRDIQQLKANALNTLDKRIATIRTGVDNEIEEFDDFDSLKQFVAKKLGEERTEDLRRIRENIVKFR